MPTANSLRGGTQPEAGATVFSCTGTTPESLRIDCVGHAAQAHVAAGRRSRGKTLFRTLVLPLIAA
jgi:hypothetical protein